MIFYFILRDSFNGRSVIRRLEALVFGCAMRVRTVSALARIIIRDLKNDIFINMHQRFYPGVCIIFTECILRVDSSPEGYYSVTESSIVPPPRLGHLFRPECVRV